MTTARPTGAPDAYVAYVRSFFGKWLPYYDMFALSVAWVYRAAARRVGAREGLHVLDVCTGTGEMALRCARRGARVTGIDVTEPMLERARAKAGELPVEFLMMDARSLQFADSSFDVTTISLALHDMPRRVRLQVLREIARVTRRRIVVLDYQIAGPPWVRQMLTGVVNRFETAYFKRFAEEGLDALLAEAGLQSAEVSRAGFPFFECHVIRL